MRAPSPGSVSTSTCPPTSPPSELAARLTALGLKLEALERPGARHHRPAGGRPGAHDASPSRRRTARPSAGARSTSATPTAPASRRASSAARTTSRVGDLVVGDPARRRAARWLRDLRAQDLRARLGRDDLLGRASSASATTTTASSCCRPTPASPATTSFDVLQPARRGHRVRDQPRPRLRPVPARGGPRGGAGLRRRRSPTRRDRDGARLADERRLPGRRRRPRRLPGLRRPAR